MTATAGTTTTMMNPAAMRVTNAAATTMTTEATGDA